MPPTAPLLLRPPPRLTRPVLLAVAHGSRDPRAADTLDRLVHRVRALAPDTDVRLSYVDHANPSIYQALDEVAAQRQSAVVVPFLLSAATHSKGDIPGSIAAARTRHPGLTVSYGRVLGPHPLLLEALEQRLVEAGVPADAALVLAGTGSADPDANANVARMARLLWEVRRSAPVEVAFATGTTPTVTEALSRLRRLGHRKVAVAAYFLSPGRLLDAVAADANGVAVSAPLADTDHVARLLLERYAEAVAGHSGMDCDCCVYRTAWPGREQRVGQPQRPHAHPGDRA
ncbi:MAG: sirohydrochlorin chelatase [Geodermatophilaceae bacterium]|nr:sirohydrochlorin chelatase [Geodermatophilaceae bacterium]